MLKKLINKNKQVKEIRSNIDFCADKIRLIYAEFTKHHNKYTGETKSEATRYLSPIFSVPPGMNIEDACKVVSHITEIVESGREQQIKPASIQSVQLVSVALLAYGFREEPTEWNAKGYYHLTSLKEFYPETKAKDGVVDLITYCADEEDFKKTDLSGRYFDWFTQGVTKTELADIYDKATQKKEQEKTI